MLLALKRLLYTLPAQTSPSDLSVRDLNINLLLKTGEKTKQIPCGFH